MIFFRCGKHQEHNINEYTMHSTGKLITIKCAYYKFYFRMLLCMYMKLFASQEIGWTGSVHLHSFI